MRRWMGLATGLAMLGGLGATGAGAVPLTPATGLSTAGAVTLVRDGCGPGAFRNRFGDCRREGWRGRGPGLLGVPGFVRPRYEGRRCVIRQTYNGPRRICRW